MSEYGMECAELETRAASLERRMNSAGHILLLIQERIKLELSELPDPTLEELGSMLEGVFDILSGRD